MSVVRLLRGRLCVTLPLAVAFALFLLFIPVFAGRGIRIDGSNITFYDFVMMLLLLVPITGWDWLTSTAASSGGVPSAEPHNATTLELYVAAAVLYGFVAAVVGTFLDWRRRDVS